MIGSTALLLLEILTRFDVESIERERERTDGSIDPYRTRITVDNDIHSARFFFLATRRVVFLLRSPSCSPPLSASEYIYIYIPFVFYCFFHETGSM